MATSVQGPVTPNYKGPRHSPLISRRPHNTAAAQDSDDEDVAPEDDPPDGRAPLPRRSSRSPTPLTTQNLDLFNNTSHEAGHDSTQGMFDLDGIDGEDFELNDDDDDYGELDNVSDGSDHSDAFEKAVEQDIMNDGEAGIDWDDEATFRYDDSWEANQYSLSIDLGEPSTPLERELLQRRPPPAAPAPADLASSNHLSTFLKGTPLDEDWSSSSSESSADQDDQGADADDERRGSNASADMADDESQAGAGAEEASSSSSSSSSSGEETDEDLPQIETVSTPAVALNRANSLRRPVVRSPASVRSSIETPDRRRPGRFGMMRKFVINPNKAVAFSSPDPGSPGGRTIHFNAPKNRNFNWLSRHASRSSSVSTPRTPMHEEHARTLTETINGRLFQRFNCNPEAIAAMSGRPRSEFSSGLLSHRQPLNWNASTSSLPGGVLADFQDADIDDSAHEEFFDFEAVSAVADDDDVSSNNPSQITDTPMPPPPRPHDMSTAKGERFHEPSTPTPLASRAAAPPSSPLAHFARPAKPELGAAFEPTVKAEPPSPESDTFAASATASSSPRKRRPSAAEDATTLTPVMKRQRF